MMLTDNITMAISSCGNLFHDMTVSVKLLSPLERRLRQINEARGLIKKGDWEWV